MISMRINSAEMTMSNPEPLLSEFLTTIELAAELGRNKRTLDRWNALGTGPPRTHMGRTVLYRRSSVQKWLAVQENQAGIVSVAGPQRQKPQIELEIGFVNFAIGELMADSLCALFCVAYGPQ